MRHELLKSKQKNKMSMLEKVLQIPEEERGGTSGPDSPPQELAVNQQEKEMLCPLLEQLRKINEKLSKMDSILISRQKLITETTRKMLEIEQKSNLTLGFQDVKEEEKEDLGFTLTNVLAPLTGSEATKLKEEVDKAPKAYSAFLKENTLPVEGDVEHTKRQTRDLISFEEFVEPRKPESQKFKEKEKRKKDFIFKIQKLLKRRASREEDAVFQAGTSKEDSSPGESGDGTEDFKVKMDSIRNWKRFKKKIL